MNDYRYILLPYKGKDSRGTCVSCRHRHEFAVYMDKETGEKLPDHVGRCNREFKCGYHYTPKQYFQENGIKTEAKHLDLCSIPEPVKPIDFLPSNYAEQSFKCFDRNNLFIFLTWLFGEKVALDVFRKYKIGTSIHWRGANIYWQYDFYGNLRQCKIMLHNPTTGKRVRKGTMVEKYDKTKEQYVENVTEQDCALVYGRYLTQETRSLNLEQCFFGEHLLAEYPGKMVGIVESEKTCLIASVFYPELVWIATGGTNGCKWTDYSVNKVLEGRTVVLYPDACIRKNTSNQTPYEKWQERACHIQETLHCNIKVSELLERFATDEQIQNGWDMADFLINLDDKYGWALTDHGYPAFWDYKTA